MSNTDKKPTAVVVPLPISTEQAQKMYEAYCSAFARSSGTTRGSATTAAILAIGTPVAGGELNPLAYVNAARLKWKIATNKDICLSFSGTPNPSSGTLNLVDGIVLYTDHQAALAAAQAEIVQLRNYLETVRSYLKEAPSVTARRGAFDVIEEALKGGNL